MTRVFTLKKSKNVLLEEFGMLGKTAMLRCVIFYFDINGKSN